MEFRRGWYRYSMDSANGREYYRLFVSESTYVAECYVDPAQGSILTWHDNESPRQGVPNSGAEFLPEDPTQRWANASSGSGHSGGQSGGGEESPSEGSGSAGSQQRGFVATSGFGGNAGSAYQWFVATGGPRRLNNRIEPLVNGEHAFRAVSRAIQAASHTVDIISWGFDASIRLERPGGVRFGELLRRKGAEGVKVKLLIWRNPITQLVENTVPGANQSGAYRVKDVVTWGAQKIFPPRRTPSPEHQAADAELREARRKLDDLKRRHLSAKQSQWMNPQGHQAAQAIEAEFGPKIAAAEEDVRRLEQVASTAARLPATTEKVEYGDGSREKMIHSAGAPGDPDSIFFNRQWHGHAQGGELENVDFRVRDYSIGDKHRIALEENLRRAANVYRRRVGREIEREAVPWAQWVFVSAFPSHHQKMILIDYEHPERAVGFVMGHNFHNNYWDTSEHHYEDGAGRRVPGFGPWQDLSTRVTGPVLYDLNRNFCTAWDAGSPWYKRWFNSLEGARDSLRPQQFVTTPGNMRSTAQITRTQFQEGKERSILDSYKQAMGHARDYIYFENQYFRYKPLADLLRETRKALLTSGRNEAKHGVCHVFVVTNVADSHSRNPTYEMMNALGRADTLPAVHRDVTTPGQPVDRGLKPQDVAGLKVNVATLKSGTRKSGNQNQYRDVYVHSKLMVVDDVFFTLGSTNINVRSLEYDSELNIASDDPELATRWRQELFQLHGGGSSKDDVAEEFVRWSELMAVNKENIQNGRPIAGHLIEYFDDGPKSGFTLD